MSTVPIAASDAGEQMWLVIRIDRAALPALVAGIPSGSVSVFAEYETDDEFRRCSPGELIAQTLPDHPES